MSNPFGFGLTGVRGRRVGNETGEGELRDQLGLVDKRKEGKQGAVAWTGRQNQR